MLNSDHEFMARAVRLARRGLYTTDPNPRVGCVIVGDGRIIGEGWHQFPGEAHAEILALEQAGERARGATVYVTLEPCCHHGKTPPCSDALISAGVARVLAAMEDPNPEVAGRGLAQLAAAGIESRAGILGDQAASLNPGHIMRMRQQRPFVRCKLAMSLDGRTAMASGESQWITSEQARRDAHLVRARSSVIMTGIGTVITDNPSLTVRLDDPPDGAGTRIPTRVVLDPALAMPRNARMLGLPGRTWILTAHDNVQSAQDFTQESTLVVGIDAVDGNLDLHAVMGYLATQEVNEVLLESGATLSGAMLQAGLIDELILYVAPHLMGDTARGLFHLPELQALEQCIRLEITDIRAVGSDWRISARPVICMS